MVEIMVRFFWLCGFVAWILVTPTPVVAKTDPAEKSAELLRHGDRLLAKGRAVKARKAFEKAWLLAPDCAECAEGWARSSLQDGDYEAAAHAVRELTDLVRQAEDETTLQPMLEALAVRYREAYTGGEPDPDLLWGLFDLLATLGRDAQIFEFTRRFLVDADDARRSVLCAVDHRPSLSSGRGELPIGEKLNKRLYRIGWPGPYLIAGEVRAPRKRRANFREGGQDSVRMVGVISKRGYVEDLRLVERPPGKRLGNARGALSGSFFTPASYDGERVTACQPFEVVYDIRPPGSKKPRGGTRVTSSTSSSSPLTGDYQAELQLPGDSEVARKIAEISDIEALFELLTAEKLIEAELLERAAVCAAHSTIDAAELNRRLVASDWPGPFLVADGMSQPEKASAPQPQYDEEARKARIQGIVVVQSVVDAQGGTHVSRVLETPDDRLTRNAIEAIERWSFRPAKMAGREVPVCHELTVNFRTQ